jgi:hypothetical protein
MYGVSRGRERDRCYRARMTERDGAQHGEIRGVRHTCAAGLQTRSLSALNTGGEQLDEEPQTNSWAAAYAHDVVGSCSEKRKKKSSGALADGAYLSREMKFTSWIRRCSV